MPHGKCRPPPYCFAADLDVGGQNWQRGTSLQSLFEGPTLNAGVVPLDELCCPFDHGIVIPSSSLLTVQGEHRLYYEGRQGYHEARYNGR